MAPLSPYQKKLFVFLSVATFFEGYDFLALSQILPNLRGEMGLSKGEAGIMVAVINVGTILAYGLVRKADRWGRRRVLMVTIVGYTLFTGLSGLAPDVYSFTALQLLARLFLIAEWATAMVFAAEEYPAERRGMVMGVIQGFSSLGSVVCAATVPLLLTLPWGWRSVYFAGVIPLLLLAFARRGIQETERFERARAERSAAAPSFWAILAGPYRTRILQLALIWALTYMCTQNAITWWKEFAVAERGLTDGQVGLSITIAAVGSMPLVFLAGKLLDVVGRRRGAVLIYVATAVGVAGSYTLEGHVALTVGLVGGIFGASAVLPVLNAYTAELFPTEHRGDAYAWANNLLGRTGYVLAPLLVGFAAADYGWGPSVAATAVFPLIALALILRWLPETRGKELEETSRVS
jgi:MFS transporter, putative metabolite:H+ symporter